VRVAIAEAQLCPNVSRRDGRGALAMAYAGAVASLPLTGGCLCGRVRYAIDEPLVLAGYCHCTRCQRRTGTAASPQARSFRFTAGERLVEAYDPGDGGFPKFFCSACGSSLGSRHPTDPAIVSIRLGTFDADPGIRPSYRAYVAYAAPWETIPDDGLPRFDEARPAHL
jgi:hypothetical protein